MLPRAQRIRTQREYDRVWQGRRSARGRYFTMRGTPNVLKTSRFGFIIGKTVAKKANVRNLIKRRLREIARPLVSDAQHWDLTINVQAAAVKATFAELKQELLQLHHQLLHAPTRRFPHHPLPRHPVARSRPQSR